MNGMDAVELQLALDGRSTTVRAPLPAGPQPAEALLPLMRAVVDAVVEDRAARSALAGQPVRCAKGCSACCRAQPVPVTPPEARALAALVQRQPAPRRAALQARFADRTRRLREAGLHGVFSRAEPLPDPAAAAAAAQAYQRLGLVCPFLEDDACSIHTERPFVCRQYLVTSDPARCADPPPGAVAVLPMPLRPAAALLQATRADGAAAALTVPLVLALEHAAAHPAAAAHEPQALLASWLGALQPQPDSA
jgi:Fe-S-cluster containining protein